jgi:hypothetical protein
MVTLNCHQALAQIYRQWERKRLQSDLVWIDCLCINQYDVDEKNAQVSIIGEIFSKATEVFACLGSHRDNSEMVLWAAREIADFGITCEHADFLCHDCGLPWTRWVLSLGFDRLQTLSIATQKFGERDYWGRVWIVQEVSKASSLSILCGNDILPWKPLSDLKTFLVMDMEEMSSISSAFEALPSCGMTLMYDVFAAKDLVISPSEVFDRYYGFKCFDPRDHLYGLLSIIRWPEGMEQILPDYTTSTHDLALQVEAYVDLECFPDMLALLQIGQDNKSMRYHIHRRRSQPTTVGQRTSVSESQEAKFRPACGERGGELPVCGRLRTNSLGELTASFVRMIDVAGSPAIMLIIPSPETPQPPPIPLTQQLEESEWHVASISSPSGSHQVYRKLLLDTELIGLICSEARADDILFPLHNNANEATTNRVYIVLRPNHDNFYDIIGQAVVVSGYGFSRSHDGQNGVLQAPTFEAKVELKLSADDAFVLFAQDYTCNDEGYDEQSRWKRVCTSITDTPVEAARVTVQTSLSNHKEDWQHLATVDPQRLPDMCERLRNDSQAPGHVFGYKAMDL